MNTPWFLLLPFASSILYCFATMLLKRAISDGVGPWRSAFVSNWAMVPVMLPLLKLPEATRTKYDLSSIHAIIH
ncbi:MAG: hypothetical protein SNJ52_04345, partial [Verrucomicrobiia bacterium]